ncbi:8-oxo-dGTP diphosphatase MutT [Pedobacter mucosus]|uniref:8-oxo-dGTP diphosphatase MutT n=1 Tax=Pedobacter mucosus TaxID=2895286 RepID=UPI001EE3AA47|nr:8-oxo-dGTP diphosphatase MutT [Pedobacter mucosus]UKT62795.1 8-oxo-dGTP diphosphatase MutT [Pedobacter mucosus]
MEKLNHIKSKSILVACAIIKDDFGNILVAQRSANMTLPLKWEFPGGKVENGETYEQAIVREIREELSILITICDKLSVSTYRYPTFSITLIPFLCKIKEGEIKLTQHQTFCWLNSNNLLDLDWAEADIPVAQQYLNSLNK